MTAKYTHDEIWREIQILEFGKSTLLEAARALLVKEKETKRLVDIGLDAASEVYDTPVFGGQLDRDDPMIRTILHAVAAMIVASRKVKPHD